ncbi:hypothetical protein GOBAR_AA21822 [Gossypium barbadense]|uniref:Uncharacterized protein n=1 Tax=Gossypium barbadense TaxID=3634 RepID=A0A2P5X693_GOSBA|nr:hypothetical protein GOBAR_AA21822 [Gossypium barbadense]
MADAIQALLTTDPWELFFGIIEPTYLEREWNSAQRSIFRRQIHFSPSKWWHMLAPSTASCNPSRSKASVLPPSPRYLPAILAHTITGRQESTSVVNTHDVFFLWCMSQGHVINLAYFITLVIQHQTERHQKGPKNHPSPDSSMLSMRMIERHQGTYPPQYCFTQSNEEEAYKDIPDDVPLQHEDPPTQPLPPSRPVHAAASYADISERLTRFEQQCFQQFDNIDATLQQICQHLHISLPVPPRESSSDEDV